MAKPSVRTRGKTTQRSVFEITELAQDARLRHSELADAPVFFEDSTAAPIKDVVSSRSKKPEGPVLTHVDKVLQQRSKVPVPTQTRIRKGVVRVEDKLARRARKSLQNVKAPRAAPKLEDTWEEEESLATASSDKRQALDSLLPQAMSYRPDERAQLALLSTMERQEQRKLDRSAKWAEDAERIKRNVLTPHAVEEKAEEAEASTASSESLSESEESKHVAERKAPKPKTEKERARQAAHKAMLREHEQRRQQRLQEKKLRDILAGKLEAPEVTEEPVKKERSTPKAAIRLEEVILPEERAEALRTVSTSGNLLRDVYGTMRQRLGMSDKRKRARITLKVKHKAQRY